MGERERDIVKGRDRQAPIGAAKPVTDFSRRLERVALLVGDLYEFIQTEYNAPGGTRRDVAEKITNISGGALRVHPARIGVWMKQLGIPAKSQEQLWADEIVRDRREKAMKANWEDPQRHAEIVEKMQKKKAEHRAAKKKTAKEREREEALQEARDTLGGDPSEILRRWIYDERLSREKIAERMDISIEKANRLLRHVGISVPAPGMIRPEARIVFERAKAAGLLAQFPPKFQRGLQARFEGNPALSLEGVKDIYGVTTKERVRQLEKEALARLAKLLEGVPLPKSKWGETKQERQQRSLGEDPKEGLRVLVEHFTTQEIADQLGVTPDTVRRWKKEMEL